MSILRKKMAADASPLLNIDISDRPEWQGMELDVIVRPARASSSRHGWRAGVDEIPPSGKVIGDEETEAMIDAAMDGWLTTGRFNAEFERRLADFVGVAKCFTVNSGSSANLVALSALTSPKLGHRAIMPGDEVITVAAGFPTTVNPIIQNGAIPVFVDVTLPTYNIDIKSLEQARSSRTKAIMVAHTLGNPFDLSAVSAFAKQYGLWLIEDCCDALGSTWHGRKVGSFGDLATLSFYPAHHITMGEGGAVLGSDPLLMQIAESFRDWGRDCWCEPGCDNSCGKRFDWQLGGLPRGYDHKYTYSHLGYNLKITDMQAACGLAQLQRLDAFIAARKGNFSYLYSALREAEDFLHLPEATPGSDPAWFGFPITLKPKCDASRSDLIDYLVQKKIGTRLLFAGNITKQPYMLNREYRLADRLDNTDLIMRNTFWVGVWPGLSRAQLDYMATAIKEFFGIGF